MTQTLDGSKIHQLKKVDKLVLCHNAAVFVFLFAPTLGRYPGNGIMLIFPALAMSWTRRERKSTCFIHAMCRQKQESARICRGHQSCMLTSSYSTFVFACKQNCSWTVALCHRVKFKHELHFTSFLGEIAQGYGAVWRKYRRLLVRERFQHIFNLTHNNVVMAVHVVPFVAKTLSNEKIEERTANVFCCWWLVSR